MFNKKLKSEQKVKSKGAKFSICHSTTNSNSNNNKSILYSGYNMDKIFTPYKKSLST